MKAIGIGMSIVLWLCVTSTWADEKASKSVLNKSIIFYGGIQVYQADGEFGYVKDEYPDITIDMDDLGLDENSTENLRLPMPKGFNFFSLYCYKTSCLMVTMESVKSFVSQGSIVLKFETEVLSAVML